MILFNKQKFCYLLPFLLMIGWLACSREKLPDMQKDQKNIPDQEMWDFKVRATNQGRLNAIIRAGHMQRFKNQSLAEFSDGVEIDFYNDKGEHTSRLLSDSGRYRESNMNVRAIGNVKVHSDSGISLYTEELVYNQESDRIYSNVDVMVTTLDGDTLSGRGFESDAQLTRWQIINPHDGVYHKGMDLGLSDDNNTAHTKADSLE